MDALMVAAAIVFVCNAGNAVAPDPLASRYGNLVFATLLYRHGDRSIENTYSNDPYEDKYYWPMGFGQLTPAGIQRHFELGKWLRNRYRGWLPEIYDAEDVYVRSTDFDRTLMSAEANLAGMYPPVGPRDWNGAPGKRVQLIPIHTAPKSQDNVLAMSADCPLYSQESNKMMDSLTIQQYYSKFGSVLEYIKNYTHLEMDKQSVIYSTQTLYYALLIESQFHYVLPKWTNNIFPKPLESIVKENMKFPTYNNIMKRLKAGPLLNEIVTRLSEKKNGILNPNRKLWVYSAHDVTIVNLLNSMQLFNYMDVPYAALVLIELRLNDTGNYVVTISYRNTSDEEPYLLYIPGCDSVACELDKLIDVLSPIIPVDWDSECKIDDTNIFSELLIYLVGFIIAAVILVLLSYAFVNIIVNCFRKRSDYQSF